MDRNFGGVVWTNHALDRLRERGIKQGDAWAAFQRPDQSRFASSKKAWIYYRTFEEKKIEVVAKKDLKGKWVILSVWSKPAGEKFAQEKVESLFSLVIKRLFKK